MDLARATGLDETLFIGRRPWRGDTPPNQSSSTSGARWSPYRSAGTLPEYWAS
jgi:hypothetical protein